MLKSIADPFDALDAVDKFAHHFEESQRIRVKADGRRGKIENFNAKQHVNVRLDSGHFVECLPDEIEPEDWNSGESFDGKKFRGLIAAIEAGAVSAFDLNLLKRARENTATRRGFRDPLDFDESADHRVITLLVEKYGDTETLAKRAREWRVGDEVIEKFSARRARITNVGKYSIDLDYGDGTTATVLGANIFAA